MMLALSYSFLRTLRIRIMRPRTQFMGPDGFLCPPEDRRYPDPKLDTLISVTKGTPWTEFAADYQVKLERSVTAAHHQTDHSTCHIRRLDGEGCQNKVRLLTQFQHEHILQIRRIFSGDDGIFAVSEPMFITLENVARAPKYPTEPQLGEIAFQVSTVPFLMLHQNPI